MTACDSGKQCGPALLVSAELGPKALDQAVDVIGNLAEQLRRRVPPLAPNFFEGEIEPEGHVERIAVIYLTNRDPRDLKSVVQWLTDLFRLGKISTVELSRFLKWT